MESIGKLKRSIVVTTVGKVDISQKPIKAREKGNVCSYASTFGKKNYGLSKT